MAEIMATINTNIAFSFAVFSKEVTSITTTTVPATSPPASYNGNPPVTNEDEPVLNDWNISPESAMFESLSSSLAANSLIPFLVVSITTYFSRSL